MRTFNYEELKNISWDSDLVNLVSKNHEYKGKQELFLRQKPDQLDRLVDIAKVQSTEASNRIEGIVTVASRLNALLTAKTTPRNRDEQEIIGYRKVLETIHTCYSDIDIKANIILQLHRDLLQYTPMSYGGHFKNAYNEIDKINSNGEREVLFRPVSPFETPGAIEMICEEYNKCIAKEEVDSLILICVFILDFLCIHPFIDGNGRMSRLLTLLLLYKSGYMVGQYISIEKEIADTKEL